MKGTKDLDTINIDIAEIDDNKVELNPEILESQNGEELSLNNVTISKEKAEEIIKEKEAYKEMKAVLDAEKENVPMNDLDAHKYDFELE